MSESSEPLPKRRATARPPEPVQIRAWYETVCSNPKCGDRGAYRSEVPGFRGRSRKCRKCGGRLDFSDTPTMRG